MIEDAAIRLIGEPGRTTESIPDKKVISVIPTAVNGALANGFRSVAFYSAVQQAIHKCEPKHPSVDAGAAKLVDSLSFTVASAEMFQHEIEKSSLDKAKIEKRFVLLAEAVREEMIKTGDGNLTRKIDPARYSSHPTNMFDD